MKPKNLLTIVSLKIDFICFNLKKYVIIKKNFG